MQFVLVFKLLVITAFISLFPRIAQGHDHFLLESPGQSYRLDRHIQVYIDTTNNLTVDRVIQPDFQALFRKNNDNLTFGYLESTIWLKVTTRRHLPTTLWYLEIPAPFLEYVDFYQVRQDGTWSHTKSGYFRRHSERDVSHTGHALPIVFGDDSLSTVFIQIAGISPKTFTINAIERDKFIEKIRSEDLIYGIFFGILLVMLFFNLVLYLILRQKTYFLYVLIIGLTILVFATISGYGSKFIWPEKPVFNYIYGKLVLPLLVVCLTLYTICYLEIRKYSRAVYYLLLSLLPLSGLAFFLSAARIVSSPGNNLITLATIFYIIAGIVVHLRGNKTGTYYIAAWSLYFLGGLLLTLRNSGIFDYNFWTTHFVEIGAILGVTLVGSGLGAQYRRLQKEKEEAQLLAYRIQQEHTAKLEREVSERTEQLFRANLELEKTLDTNRRQTQIIQDKNSELDSFIHRVSHDLKGPVLSSIGLMSLAKLDVKDKLALEYIDKQHAQLERLSQILNGLINLTRVNNNDMEKQEIDFNKLIDDCIASLNHLPNYGRLTFEKSVKESLRFCSEWTLVNAILQNLIENAIKYSKGDSPFVRIRVYDEDGHLVIQVEDNGLGIPAQHQPRIFEMFYRGTAQADGSGLGLYILKRSVDRLNGRIDIRSDVGVGSVFTVRLPLQQNENATT